MISIPEAELIQSEVARAFGDPKGVRDREALARALARPYASQNGIPSYPTFLGKVSALFQALLMARPFCGANRRTAFVAMAYVLRSHGYSLHVRPGEINPLLTGAELGFTTYHRITAWLKAHTRQETRFADPDAARRAREEGRP